MSKFLKAKPRILILTGEGAMDEMSRIISNKPKKVREINPRLYEGKLPRWHADDLLDTLEADRLYGVCVAANAADAEAMKAGFGWKSELRQV